VSPPLFGYRVLVFAAKRPLTGPGTLAHDTHPGTAGQTQRASAPASRGGCRALADNAGIEG